MSRAITIAKGDGIGPEIMNATLEVLFAAGAEIETEEIEIGEKVYNRGITSGIDSNAWESLERTKVFLKAPITTPQGGGFKSLNVTVRKSLGLYANVRPVQSLHPFVSTKHPKLDLVIVRENEEDLYAGIEHRQTQDVYQCLKLISRPGCEKIVRYAFEYARTHNRKKVTCFTKDNIMKMTDGLFHKIFHQVSEEYPEIENEHWIVDIGAAKLADSPEAFDVIVMPNLYGDILSDVAAQISGSVGLAGSANIGDKFAMFEAIHGSAPRRAGQNMANPSGLLLGAVHMLIHIGQPKVAALVYNAWAKTLEDGIHTYDIYQEDVSKEKVGTKEFAGAVIQRLSESPTVLAAMDHTQMASKPITVTTKPPIPAEKSLHGVDVFVSASEVTPPQLAEKLVAATQGEKLQLLMISNRGAMVWPEGTEYSLMVDHWRCRFLGDDYPKVPFSDIVKILSKINDAGIDIIKTENLYYFDDEPGYSLGQGQ